MNMERCLKVTGVLLILALAVGLEPAIGQGPPTENKGLKVGASASIDLSREIERIQGRFLRLRVLTVEPGGVIGLHSHRDRPAVAYIIQGKLTEHREGGDVMEHRAGDSWSVATSVTHWEENTGSEPLVLVAADIFKQGM